MKSEAVQLQENLLDYYNAVQQPPERYPTSYPLPNPANPNTPKLKTRLGLLDAKVIDSSRRPLSYCLTLRVHPQTYPLPPSACAYNNHPIIPNASYSPRRHPRKKYSRKFRPTVGSDQSYSSGEEADDDSDGNFDKHELPPLVEFSKFSSSFPRRGKPSKSIVNMDNNNGWGSNTSLSAPTPSRPRRLSALAIAERVTALVTLRHRSNSTTPQSRSRSRSNSDALSPESLHANNNSNVALSALGANGQLAASNTLGRSTRSSRDHSNCTTEEDKESSEEMHSADDSLDFGLLEVDPFANLSAPPSELASPTSRYWLRSLSSEVIQEEPEEINAREREEAPKRLSNLRNATTPSLSLTYTSKFEEEIDEDDGDSSSQHTNDNDVHHISPSTFETDSFYERKRSNSFTQRVRNIVQSRPSLPSLSLLANTKIFVPASKSALASRFPSEPWDDPRYASPTTRPGYGPSSSSSGNNYYSGGQQGGGAYGGRYNSENGGYGYPPPISSGSRGGMGGHGGGDGWHPPSGGGSAHQSTGEDAPTTTSSEDSDDKPLGQRPNALNAQKSLRNKIKEERRVRKDTLKPKVLPLLPLDSLSPPKASSKDQPSGLNFSADDLTARLLRLRTKVVPSSLPSSPNGRTAFPSLSKQTSISPQARSPSRENFPPYDTPPVTAFKMDSNVPPNGGGPSNAFAFPSSTSPPVVPPIRRHATDVTSSSHKVPFLSSETRPKMPERSMTSFESSRNGRASHDYKRPSKETPAQPVPVRTRADTLMQKAPPSGPSLLRQRANSLHSSARPQPAVQPPLPPLPQPSTSSQGSNTRHPSISQDSASDISYGDSMQQRIFVESMQRFSVVEIGPRTNAREVIHDIIEKGDLDPEEMQSGDWMLYEVANDFGMERPIREYEVVMEVYNSWNSDMRVNYFMLKRTPLAKYLSADAIPKSSPTYGGYVEWEHKRGKWTKRWLELREHSLWISKRQGAKDATVLCTFSNFDFYQVTRLHKSPKPFVFSVKSTQSMRLFERASDYHHVFCCDAMEGNQWSLNILLARSYVLHQERTVLFRQLNAFTDRPVARSNTNRVPAAPLLSLDAPPVPSIPPSRPSISQPVQSPGLEGFNPMPGSLLSKRR
ncbi:hypothetical protein CPB86DRAFT_808333 [Serendipita vermifera]|nr:hypothetical protein CPB86DRAFT_808333 [Serendipita vermifera]